jgi:hypothetical protein
MALLAEYALTPDVFDTTSYSSSEVCGLHLQSLKEVLLQEGLVRNLYAGRWLGDFDQSGRPWHLRGKELLKKLVTQKRLVSAPAVQASAPATDADWCLEALASNAQIPLSGIIATDAIAAPHSANPIVSPVARLTSATWWASRSSSIRLNRTLAEYQTALDPTLRHANSLMFIDPYIDPTDTHQYGDLMRLLAALKTRVSKPLIEVHRASWLGGGDKIPRVSDVKAAVEPSLKVVAQNANISIEVFLWDKIHDRYLITDLIGINLPNGFGTTRDLNATTTWTRLGRNDRDSVQRDFDPAHRAPRYRFKVP